MRLKLEVPKEKIDEALRSEIAGLRKEVAKLKKQLERAEALINSGKQKRLEVEGMYTEFKAMCDKWASHDGCSG